MLKSYLIIILSLCSYSISTQDKVGVNILTPEYTLDIRSTSVGEQSILNLGNSNNDYNLRFSSAAFRNGTHSIYWTDNASLRFIQAGTFDTEILRINEFGNLGINNNSPTEKLDVTGNIKISGEIMPDGNPGETGQFLQSDGSGGMVWMDMKSYTSFQGFDSDDTWLVPTGVTEILVEIWGAGGGGSKGGGGGGGGYLSGLMPVTSGESLTIDVGSGGMGAASGGIGSNGEISYVYQSSNYYRAEGGFGAPGADVGNGGFGGSTNNPLFTKYYIIYGENGNRNHIDYAQKNATTFVEILNRGRGGNGANSIKTGGEGSQIIINEATSATIQTVTGNYGRIRGGGGGAALTTGYGGGKGYVIIWWKS